MNRQEIQKFKPFLEFGMNYKSLEFGPDLKEESSMFKIDSMSTNYKVSSLTSSQCKNTSSGSQRGSFEILRKEGNYFYASWDI